MRAVASGGRCDEFERRKTNDEMMMMMMQKGKNAPPLGEKKVGFLGG